MSTTGTDPLVAKLRSFGFAFVPRYAPLSPDEVSAAREYRELGLTWAQIGSVLHRNKTSVRLAVIAIETYSQ